MNATRPSTPPHQGQLHQQHQHHKSPLTPEQVRRIVRLIFLSLSKLGQIVDSHRHRKKTGLKQKPSEPNAKQKLLQSFHTVPRLAMSLARSALSRARSRQPQILLRTEMLVRVTPAMALLGAAMPPQANHMLTFKLPGNSPSISTMTSAR